MSRQLIVLTLFLGFAATGVALFAKETTTLAQLRVVVDETNQSRKSNPSLQEQVDYLAYYLEKAQEVIAAQQEQLAALQQRQDQNKDFLFALQEAIAVDDSELMIISNKIRLSAGTIQLDAPSVSAPGVLESNTLITTSVVSDSYTPGVGNLW